MFCQTNNNLEINGPVKYTTHAKISKQFCCNFKNRE